MKTLSELITVAIDSSLPGRGRSKALAAIKWRLSCPQLGLWAGLDERGEIIPCLTPDDPRVQVFDGRDNEFLKVKYYRAATGIEWRVELCNQ